MARRKVKVEREIPTGRAGVIEWSVPQDPHVWWTEVEELRYRAMRQTLFLYHCEPQGHA